MNLEECIESYREELAYNLEKARKNGEICIEQSDVSRWKIHDPQGYYATLGVSDWSKIQDYLNGLYYDKSSNVFLERMDDYIIETICHECKQNCYSCAVYELKKSILRKLPPTPVDLI